MCKLQTAESPRGTDVYLSNTSKPESIPIDSSATSSPNSHHNPLLPEPLCYFPKPKRSFAARTAHSWERHLSYAPHTQLYGFQPCFRPRCVDPR